MRLLLRLIAALIVIVAVLLGVGMFLPREVTIERSIEIDAPASEVYPRVANLAAAGAWSPWLPFDPDTKLTFNNIAKDKGAVMEWASDHPQVGYGRMEVVEAVQDESLEMALDFQDRGTGAVSWDFTEENGKTTATWGMVADMGAGPIGRWMGLKMDDWVGTDYERGLQKLKALVEGS